MNSSKHPGWFRGLEVLFGVAAMVLGLLVLVFPGLGVATLIILLALGLLFASFRTVSVLGLRRLSTSLKAVGVVLGIVCLILAVLVVTFPRFGAASLIVLLSFGLLVYGLSRIFHGYMHRTTASWHRGTVLAVGVLAVVLSAVVLIFPDLTLVTLAAILAVALILVGAEMALSGATGVSRFTVSDVNAGTKSAN